MILRDLLRIYAAEVIIKAKSASIGRKVLRSTSLEEFLEELEKYNSDRFSFYEGLAPLKKLGNAEILGHLDIHPRGLAILDIGPGYGEFLDKCNEMHAANKKD